MARNRLLFPVPYSLIPAFFTSPLVTGGIAFYNPSNTALKTVVSYTRYSGARPSKRMDAHSAGKCMNFDLYFGNSQEY
jgi:hypothetical protein